MLERLSSNDPAVAHAARTSSCRARSARSCISGRSRSCRRIGKGERAMKRVAALALALALCAATRVGERGADLAASRVGTSMSKELSTRIAPKGEPLDLDRFLPAEDMEDLLGTWSAFGGEHVFQNGLPNSVNMVIWHASLSRFRQEHRRSCMQVRNSSSTRKFSQIAARSCAPGPQPAPRSERAADGLLAQRHGLQRAGRPNLLAWRDFFLASYQATARRRDRRRHDAWRSP